MRTNPIRLTVLALFVMTSSVFGLSDLELSSFSNVNMSYDPLNNSDTVLEIQYVINNPSNESKQAFMAVGKSSGVANYTRRVSNADHGSLNYQLYSEEDNYINSRIIKDIGNLTSNNTSRITIPAGQSVTGTFYLKINTGILYRGGVSAVDELRVRFYEGAWTNSPSASDLIQTVTWGITVNIDVYMYLSFDDDNEDIVENTVDFDVIENGESISFDMEINANTSYIVEAFSDNAYEVGAQALAYNGSDTRFHDETIDYLFKVNGATIDISSEDGATIYSASSARTIQITIQINENVLTKARGTYGELITVLLSEP